MRYNLGSDEKCNYAKINELNQKPLVSIGSSKGARSVMKRAQAVADQIWDLWCIASGIGIWPRFIEPNILKLSSIELLLPSIPQSLCGLKVLQFSDLHIHPGVPNRFLRKIVEMIRSLNADLITFTGDFICNSQLDDSERLSGFLNSLRAPLGCYAVLGNHDYEQSVAMNKRGEYDLVASNHSSSIVRGFKRLFSTTQFGGKTTSAAAAIPLHGKLCQLLKKTPFHLLHNECVQLSFRGTKFNICGFGDYLLGKCDPEKVLAQYDMSMPGISLLHNPDGISMLNEIPSEIVLSGHTHGGQVNIPWLWKKFIPMENLQFKRGLCRYREKWLYVNRGVGSVMPFRWFAPPELLLLTLRSA